MSTTVPVALRPASTPPPGVEAVFDDPPTMQGLNILLVVLCLTLTTVVLSMRIYTKFFITRTRGWEDYTSIAAWFASVVFVTVGLHFSHYGAGIDQWNLRLKDLPPLRLLGYVVEAVYSPTIFLTKLSILIQCIKIFAASRSGVIYYASQSLIWLNAMFYVAIFFAEIFQCTPVSAAWLPTRGQNCINVNETLIITAAINVASDFAILILPLYAIWHLQMSSKRKAAISVAFATGLFACTASILRLYYSIVYSSSSNQTHLLILLLFWSYAEIFSGILAGCIPLLARFIQHFTHHPSSRSQLPSTSQPRSFDRLLHPTKPPPTTTITATSSYIPLSERNPGGAVPTDPRPSMSSAIAYAFVDSKARPEGEELTPSEADIEALAAEGGIMKTVRIETRYPSGLSDGGGRGVGISRAASSSKRF